MQSYRFSPILEEKSFQAALLYIAHQSAALAEKTLGRSRDIDTITIFAHYPDEHAYLKKTVRSYGPVSTVTHGATLYIDADVTVAGNHIQYLGVRAPDGSRPQVGYGDFPVDDYDAIRSAANPYVHEIVSGRGQSLLELRHPDFDVLGYVARKEDH
jgi:hypothetical protein